VVDEAELHSDSWFLERGPGYSLERLPRTRWCTAAMIDGILGRMV